MRVIAIELDQNDVKVAQVRYENTNAGATHQQLEHLTVRSVAYLSDAEISGAIENIFVSEGLDRDPACPVIACLPRQQVTVRYLSLPSQRKQELQEMARMAIHRQLPYPPEEIVSDSLILEKNPDGYTRVMAVVAQVQTVRRTLSILEGAKILPEKLVLSSLATYALFIHHSAESFQTEPSSVALLNINASSVDVGVVSGPHLIFSRSLVRDETEVASWPEKIFSDFRLSLFTYNQENPESPIRQIVLLGNPIEAERLKKFLEKEFPVPVRYLSAVDVLPSMPGIVIPEQMKIWNTSFSAVLGAPGLLRAPTINLLPPELQKVREEKVLQHQWIFLSALLLSALLCCILRLSFDCWVRWRYLQGELNGRVHAADKQTRALKLQKDKIVALRKFLQEKPDSLLLLKTIQDVFSEEVALTSLLLDRQGILTIQGNASNLEAVVNSVKLLEHSGKFRKSELKSSFLQKQRDQERINFLIQCEWLPVEKREREKTDNSTPVKKNEEQNF